MTSYGSNTVPQVGCDPTGRSDRVKAPVATTSLTDSEGGNPYDVFSGPSLMGIPLAGVGGDNATRFSLEEKTLYEKSENRVIELLTSHQKIMLESDQLIQENLKQMLEMLQLFQKAMEKQKNIAQPIKEGTPKLKIIVQDMQSTYKRREAAGKQLLRQVQEILKSGEQVKAQGTKRKPSSPPGESSQRGKMGRTINGPQLQVNSRRERTASATSCRSQDGDEPRSSASSRFGDSEDSAWELNPKDHRKQQQLLRRAQKNSANLVNDAAQRIAATSELQQKKKKEKKNRKRKPRPRLDAVIIKPASGKSFADILKNINEATIPEEGPRIEKYSKTRNGSLLLKFKGNTGNTTAVAEALAKAAETTGQLESLPAVTTVRVFDLNSGITVEQVQRAVKNVIPDLPTEPVVTLSNPNQREQVIAFVTLPARMAVTFMEKKVLSVGPFRCRIRQYNRVRRCYKCLGFGHTSYTCKGPDRTEHCHKCAEKGHKAAGRKNEDKCIVCIDSGKPEEETKHRLGTGRCKTYREAWGVKNNNIASAK